MFRRIEANKWRPLNKTKMFLKIKRSCLKYKIFFLSLKKKKKVSPKEIITLWHLLNLRNVLFLPTILITCIIPFILCVFQKMDDLLFIALQDKILLPFCDSLPSHYLNELIPVHGCFFLILFQLCPYRLTYTIDIFTNDAPFHFLVMRYIYQE